MKGFLKIPDFYTTPIIAVTVLREHIREWNFANVKRALRGGKIRDPEIEEKYYQLKNVFTTQEEFCLSQPFKFVVKNEGNWSEHSDGPEILYDADNRRLFFERYETYHIPRCIKERAITAEQILTASGFQLSQNEKEEWSRKMSYNDIVEIEEE